MNALFDESAENAVLGAIVVDNTAYDTIGDVLEPEHFGREHHQQIFTAMRNLHIVGRAIDYITLKAELSRMGMLELAGNVYISQLGDGVPRKTNIKHYAAIVRDKAVLRGLRDAARKLIADAEAGEMSGAALLEQAEADVYGLGSKATASQWVPNRDVAVRLMPVIDRIFAEKRTITGVATGFTDLDNMTRGFQPADLVLVGARPSQGKAQPLNSSVLLADGTWRRMGDVRVGDDLASIDGEPSRVTGVFPQGEKSIYRVTFIDGRSVECCDEHLWSVYTTRHAAPRRVMSTAEIRAKLQTSRYKGRISVPTVTGDFGCAAHLPLDPWLLGFLIGDGCFVRGHVSFSTGDRELVGKIEALSGLNAVHESGYDYRLVSPGGHRVKGSNRVKPNRIKEALKDLGLWGLRSEDKFVPAAYLKADRGTRVQLLQGLLDSDGTAGADGVVTFCSTSLRLAEDVARLAQSIGAVAGVRARKRTNYTHNGERRIGIPSYICAITHKSGSELFTLDRKAVRVRARRKLTIVSVEPSRQAQAQCISVSHPKQLYVTDGFIPTHNTALGMQMAHHAAQAVNVAFFSIEMSLEAVGLRQVIQVANVDGYRMLTGRSTVMEQRQIGQGLAALGETRLVWDDAPYLSPLQVRSKLRRLQAQVGPLGLVVIDYLQLMAPLPDDKRENKTNQVAGISRMLKLLAREFKVPFLVLSQLHRVPDNRRPTMADLRDSGALEQDADVVLLLHRPEVYDAKPENAGLAELIIGKARNGPTGIVELSWRGEPMRFENRQRT